YGSSRVIAIREGSFDDTYKRNGEDVKIFGYKPHITFTDAEGNRWIRVMDADGDIGPAQRLEDFVYRQAKASITGDSAQGYKRGFVAVMDGTEALRSTLRTAIEGELFRDPANAGRTDEIQQRLDQIYEDSKGEPRIGKIEF